ERLSVERRVRAGRLDFQLERSDVRARVGERGARALHFVARRATIVGEESDEIVLGFEIFAGARANEPEVEEDARVRKQPVRLLERIARALQIVLLDELDALPERRSGLLFSGIVGERIRRDQQ